MNFKSSELFNEYEIKLLAPFVTNTDQSIFALKNLPEVIKGALFSRYSRSKLGLRSLLLKEFICSAESGFNEMAKNVSDKEIFKEDYIKKAQDFYDRVLDGYGDDSIGELGGAHLALEDISILATKVLEDARIGGSPLEKSTRYIYFDEKINGDYRFLKEPVLMDSPFKELYLSTCRFLFDTYSSLVKPLSSYVEKMNPAETDPVSPAYKTSVRARVCDSLRGLLPTSTLTNMGIFGNGRFFESLLQRLSVSNLQEIQEIGNRAFQELQKVVPSFIRRADSSHRHYTSWSEFFHKQEAHLKQAAEKIIVSLHEHTPPSLESVRLTDHDKDAEWKVAAALLYPHVSFSLSELRQQMHSSSGYRWKDLFQTLANERQNRRHKPPRALEHADYTFDLLADFGMFRDLHRHRILTQERQKLSTSLGYMVPEDVLMSGLEKPYRSALDQAASAYEKINVHFPHEAQYVVPLAYRIRWYFKINLRSLIWMCELRSMPQGHIHYRKMAQEIARKVMEVHPGFIPFFKFMDFDDHALGRLDQEKKKGNKN
ncbi:MAG: FAD-dependent thymidylate synthase [Candidatus Aureabacteria bacterium]|nr:FAD-dependent thymidylate synthase [Candidatus Auribacterota bacterium]